MGKRLQGKINKIKRVTRNEVCDYKKTIGSNIKFYREAKNLTQEQLAEMVDIGTSTLGTVEIGKSVPKIETIMNLAKALDVEIEALFTASGAKSISKKAKLINNKIEDIESFGRQILEFCESVQKTD